MTPVGAGTPSVRDGTRRTRMAAGLVVALVVVTSVWLLSRLLEPMRLFADDWYFVKTRYDWNLRSVLVDHAGHPSMLPALSYLVGFNTVGLDHMWWFKTVLVSSHLGVSAAVAHRVWRRHGFLSAVAAWSTVCFMGAGAQDIVHFFQIGFLGSVLSYVMSVGALGRLAEHGRPRDAGWLAGWLTVSVACSTVGVAAVLAAGAVLALDRATRRHLWSVLVPIVFYLTWRVRFGSSTAVTTDPMVMLRFLWAGVRDAGAAIAVGNEFVGVVLVAAVTVAAGRHLVLRGRPHLVSGLLFTCAFWALTTFSRADAQDRLNDLAPSRYTYVAVVGLLVAISDLVPSIPVDQRRIAVRRTMVRGAVVSLVAAGSVWAGHAELISTRDHFSYWGQWSAARLSVVDAYPGSVPRDASFDPLFFFTQITVGDYLAVSSHLGSRAGLTPDEFASLSGDVRAGAEELILPLVTVTASVADECTTTDEGIADLELDGDKVVVVETDAGARVVVSRWMPPDPGGPGVRPLDGGRWRLTTPADDLPGLWHLAFDGVVRLVDCP